jgi:thiol-disulfide isomerase/thioredoxin
MKPSLKGASGWINTQPLDLAELRGKVVLVDFWTYTCINWRRTLPYVRDWALKYKDQGLVVIGVHTPEFLFEQKPENVNVAVKEMNITYPVAMDNNYEVWNSFQNQYWPALYLIDARGNVRHEKFGEGNYEEAERWIQQLLKETATGDIPAKATVLQPEGFEVAADWGHLRSPENFLGYNRTEGFASPGSVKFEKQATYTAPRQLGVNQWALVGEWIMRQEYVASGKEHGKIIYRFHARDLHLIMGPASPGTTVRFRVLIDGNPPGEAHGLDVDSNGNGTVSGPRMYQLIRQQGPITDREFQIEFLDPGVEVYDFTFG